MALDQPLAAQSVCCTRSALDPEAGFCNDCGKPLFRCMASAECGSLLDDAGLCPVCVRPQLALDAGAAATVREGGKLALPLTITNAATIGRPLFITGLWVREEDGGLREIELPFKRLEPGATANVGVRTGRLDYAGTHQVDLLIAAATRFEWREEKYLFSSAIIFPVESKDQSGPVTNVTVNADQVGAGFTVYNPTRIESDRAAGLDSHLKPVKLSIKRADQAERRLGLRGYSSGVQVPRRVAFEWAGFDQEHAPFDGPILKPSGLICCGRNATNLATGANDVRLAVSGPNGLDEARSLAVSRQHFTLYTESGRLMLRVDSQFGLRVNGDAYGRTKTVVLNDGDTITPLRKMPNALALSVTFETQQETVTRIMLRRTSRA